MSDKNESKPRMMNLAGATKELEKMPTSNVVLAYLREIDEKTDDLLDWAKNSDGVAEYDWQMICTKIEVIWGDVQMLAHLKVPGWPVGAGKYGSDTENGDEYALTCNMIRDFCEDAIKLRRAPTDYEIAKCVGRYLIEKDESDGQVSLGRIE